MSHSNSALKRKKATRPSPGDCQGIALGAFINGFDVENGAYAGSLFDWLTPFSVFTGLGLLAAYALLGATWLIMKTEGKLQADMRRIGRPIVSVLFVVIVAVSLWTPLTHEAIARRWFALPNLAFFFPVPILVVLSTIALSRTLASGSHVLPFVLTLLFLGYTGLAISIGPNIVPPGISIWDAASPPQSLGFALIGALFIIPFILAYTTWSYYVFRGKVKAGEGCH